MSKQDINSIRSGLLGLQLLCLVLFMFDIGVPFTQLYAIFGCIPIFILNGAGK